jgi:hypothetical protein
MSGRDAEKYQRRSTPVGLPKKEPHPDDPIIFLKEVFFRP